MRIKRYLKNSVYSVINYLLILILSLLVRKALINNFSIVYTGYEALFTDIFTLLSIADLGIDNIIIYKLYEKLVADADGISEIMCIAKKIYKGIGVAILLLGILISFGFVFMFSSDKYDLRLIYIVYFIQIINLLISYFTGYKRLLFIADQKEYICLKWDSLNTIFIQLLRIFVLVVLKNYYVYMGLNILKTIVQNSIINYKYNIEFGTKLKKKPVDKENWKAITWDLKNILCHRVSDVIYAATDNIVITSLLGLVSAGVYSNYYMISKYTYSFMVRITKPMQASIGNYIYSNKDRKAQLRLLEKLNVVAFFLAVFTCNSLIHLSTPFIEIWLGKQYILEQSLVVALSVNVYIALNQDFVYYFRYSFGRYEIDKYFSMASAVVNIVSSIILGKYLGLSGIVLGTILGHFFIWYGRVKFVYQVYFEVNMRRYWVRQIGLAFVFIVQITIADHLIQNRWYGLKGCLVRESIVTIITTVSFVLYLAVKKLVKKISLDKGIDD